jgi:hypothetical protein
VSNWQPRIVVVPGLAVRRYAAPSVDTLRANGFDAHANQPADLASARLIHLPGAPSRCPYGNSKVSTHLDSRRTTRYIDDVASPDLAASVGSSDPKIGLRAVASLRRLAEQLESLQVDHARDLGWSWAQIAAELGVSKQAVNQKHGARAAEKAGDN